MAVQRSRNVKFLLWNWWARPDSTVTASSEQTDYEASNTTELSLARSWRSSGVGDAYLQNDMGTTRMVEAVALVRTNLTNAATFRVRVGNDAAMATTLYDSGTLSFHERIYTDAEITVGHISEFFSSGIPSGDTRAILQQKVRVVYLPSGVNARYVRIDLSDSTNTEGFLEVPCVFAGRIYVPSPDLFYGWRISRDNIARQQQATCGQYWSASVFRRVAITCTVALQKEVDFLGQWFLSLYLMGVNTEFIVSIEDQDDSMRFFTTIFAKFATPTRNTNVSFKRHALQMEIQEITAEV